MKIKSANEKIRRASPGGSLDFMIYFLYDFLSRSLIRNLNQILRPENLMQLAAALEHFMLK